MLRTQQVELERKLSTAHDAKEQLTQHHALAQAEASNFERQLVNAAAAAEQHGNTQALLRKRISELEAELSDAFRARDGHGKQYGTLRARITELEEQLAEALGEKEHHSRQHIALRSKHTSLEEQLTEVSATLENHVKRLSAQQRRSGEIEDELAQVVQHRDQLHKQHTVAVARTAELERMVDSHQAHVLAIKDTHAKGQSTHQARIDELTEQLEGASCARRQAESRATAAKVRVAELEAELADASEAKDHHEKSHMGLQARFQELEDEVRSLRSEHERQASQHKSRLREMETSHEQQLKGRQTRIKELEELLEGFADERDSRSNHRIVSESRVNDLEAQLHDALAARDRHYARVLCLEEEFEHAQRHQDRICGRLGSAPAEYGRSSAISLEEWDQEDPSSGSVKARVARFESAFTDERRLRELEEALGAAQREKDLHSKHRSTLQHSLRDLEEQLAIASEDKATQSKLRQGLQERIMELEELVKRLSCESADYQKTLQNAQLRLREVEVRLEDALKERDADHKTANSRIFELEAQLSNTLREKDRIKNLEARLLEAIEERDAHQESGAASSSRVAVLEKQMLEALASKDAQMSASEQKLSGLEAQLCESLAAEERLRQVSTEQAEFSEQERKKVAEELTSSAAALESELTSLRAELDDERAATERLAIEARSARDAENDSVERLRQSERTRHAIEHKLRSFEAGGDGGLGSVTNVRSSSTERFGVRKSSAERREEKRQAQLSQPSLDGAVETRNGRAIASLASVPPAMKYTRHVTQPQGTSETKSGRPMTPSPSAPPVMSYSRGELLPDSSDPFIEHVRMQERAMASVLRAAGDTHAKLIDAQIRAAIGRPSGVDLKEAIGRYERKQEIDAERRMVEHRVQALLSDLQSLRVEVDTKPQLTRVERAAIFERLSWALQQCRDELQFLRSASLLEDLPESFIETLVDIHRNGITPNREWDGGFSPMHWAAQNGRKDLVDYFMRQSGGIGMMRVCDAHGHTPVYYAEISRKTSLAYYMHQDMQEHLQPSPWTPSQAREERPASADSIPAAYLKVLDQVETQGWESVTWKGGYTLLHWAASQGNADFCRYLAKLGADANALDSTSQTPLDYATKAGHQDVVDFLGQMTSRPRRFENVPSDGASSVSEVPSKEIPKAYVKVIEQIDQIGWDKMQWARGFTLLHWAARHDRADLCARFMAQGADPYHKDDTGKNAFDYARTRNAYSALAQLEAEPPKVVPSLSSFGVSVTGKGP